MTETLPPPAGGTLRAFAAFLLRPRLLEPAGLRAPGAWRELGVMVALYVAVLIGLLGPMIGFWQTRFALPAPDAFGRISPALLVPVAVLIAPLLEEIAFRGWLTGRARALWLLACALGALALLYAHAQGLGPLWTGGGLAALAIAAAAGWLALRKRGAPSWFAALFPAIFYLSAAAFSLVHIANYPHFSALALPLIVPQLWGGLVCGFLRMRIGLPASFIAHAAANSVALTLAMLAS